MDAFQTLLSRHQPDMPVPKTIVALDPGEVTGLAVFHEGALIRQLQLDTQRVAPHGIKELLPFIDGRLLPLQIKPDVVVYENYLVYGWKSDSHAWNTLHTPRLIGGIETLTYLQDVPTHSQMAQQAKGFCTDDKLRSWGYYERGMRHARDAVRHGAYYLLFNHVKKTKST